MEDYDNLLKDLSEENIVKDENQISLYDLYNLLNLKYEELRSVTKNDKIFCNKELFGRKPYNKVVFIREHKKCEILVLPTKYIEGAFIINKNIGDNEFYITKLRDASDSRINKFIKKYYNEIMYVFSVLEKYEDLIDLENSIKKLEFKGYNYLLKVSIYNGIVNLYFEMDDKSNNSILLEYLEKNKFKIAKKTKIDLDTLDYQIRNIILESNKNNVKKLVK